MATKTALFLFCQQVESLLCIQYIRDVPLSVKVYLFVQNLGNYWPHWHEMCCGYLYWMMTHRQKSRKIQNGSGGKALRPSGF